LKVEVGVLVGVEVLQIGNTKTINSYFAHFLARPEPKGRAFFKKTGNTLITKHKGVVFTLNKPQNPSINSTKKCSTDSKHWILRHKINSFENEQFN
jgi:hypothetical protein